MAGSFTAVTDTTTAASLGSAFVSVLLTPSADGTFAVQRANQDSDSGSLQLVIPEGDNALAVNWGCGKPEQFLARDSASPFETSHNRQFSFQSGLDSIRGSAQDGLSALHSPHATGNSRGTPRAHVRRDRPRNLD